MDLLYDNNYLLVHDDLYFLDDLSRDPEDDERYKGVLQTLLSDLGGKAMKSWKFLPNLALSSDLLNIICDIMLFDDVAFDRRRGSVGFLWRTAGLSRVL